MHPTPRRRSGSARQPLGLLLITLVLAAVVPSAPVRGQDDPAPVDPAFKDPPVADEPGQSLLIMNDGRRFRGRIKDKDRFEIVLEIAGIDTRFKVADVLDIVPLKTFDEYYRELKATIDPLDYMRRFQLGEWIYSRGRLELAAAELEELLDDNPRVDQARELLRVVNAAIELEDAQNEAKREEESAPPQQQQRPQDVGHLSPTMLLTDEQVNLIRVYETDLENPPQLLIRRSTIERLLSTYVMDELLPTTPEGRKAYYRRDSVEILRDIFRLQARELYGEVQVRGEPLSLNKFRLNVHRVWLVNSCATNQCHGGLEAGRFFLFNKQAHTSNTVYTNLLILERTRLRGEPLLNYDRPERSPLLQLGLPQDRSIYPHPEVENWRPAFRDQSDPLYTRAIDWMRSMYTPRPDYPIDYEPPFVTFNLDGAGGNQIENGQQPGSDAGSTPGGGKADPSR